MNNFNNFTGQNLNRVLELTQIIADENNRDAKNSNVAFADMTEEQSLRHAEQQARNYARNKNDGRAGRTFDDNGDSDLAEIRSNVKKFLAKRKLYFAEK